MTSVIDMPGRDVLTVDGVGAPEDAPFGAAVRALFAVRAALGARDDVPLEGSYAQDGDPLRFDLDAPTGGTGGCRRPRGWARPRWPPPLPGSVPPCC
jgi:hypothetical protein